MAQVHEKEFDDEEVEDEDGFGDDAEFDDPDGLDEDDDFEDDEDE